MSVSCFCWQVFTLPKVSSKLKLKLTALEGCRVRKVTVANFGSCKTDDYSENDLAVLTNLGDIQIISLPFLKLQIRFPCIRKEDVSGIASCVFTKYGQGKVRFSQIIWLVCLRQWEKHYRFSYLELALYTCAYYVNMSTMCFCPVPVANRYWHMNWQKQKWVYSIINEYTGFQLKGWVCPIGTPRQLL